MRKSTLCGQFIALLCGFIGVCGQLSASEYIALSQGEIQSLVYKSHLMMLVDERPELEAGLIFLLEMDRRNPGQSDRVVQILHAGLDGYRAHYMGNSTYAMPREIIIASFTEYLVNHEDMSNLCPPTLEILNMLCSTSFLPNYDDSYPTGSSESQKLLELEHAHLGREDCIDQVVTRMEADGHFAAMVNRFLGDETSAFSHDLPDRIVAVNPALGQRPTIVFLSELYPYAENGPIVVSVKHLEALFQEEMAQLRASITAYQDLYLQMEGMQGDVAAYLADPERIAAMEALQAETKAGHDKLISASTAAAHSLSLTLRPAKPDTANHMRVVARSLNSMANGFKALDAATKFGKLAACGNFVSAGLNIISLIFDMGPSADEQILDEIADMKKMIVDLANHLDYRFDRVDRTLNQVLSKLQDNIQLSLDTQEEVKQARLDLLEIQGTLTRLERHLFDYMQDLMRQNLVLHLNGDLRYELRTGEQMSYLEYSMTEGGAENTFYTWAVNNSRNSLSTFMPTEEDLAEELLPIQLQNGLEYNLSYINRYLQKLGVNSLGSDPIPNPRVWFLAADAYLRLAVENPLHFRRTGLYRVDDVIDTGRKVENFFKAITLQANGQLNTAPLDTSLGYYDAMLDEFISIMNAEEVSFIDEDLHGFDASMWIDWGLQCTGKVVEEPLFKGAFEGLRLPKDIVKVACAGDLILALRSNGTLLAWGNNANQRCEIPPEATGITDIDVGVGFSLALKEDGTVIAWGVNNYGQCDVPEGLSDVTAISAGRHYAYALKADGTVVGWPNDMGMPPDLANVVAIDAARSGYIEGGYVNLALKADGSVVYWGSRNDMTVPAALAAGELDVVQIAAGATRCAAVLADGSVIGWPEPIIPTGDIVELSMDTYDSVVGLCRDGSVEVIIGDDTGMPGGTDIVNVSVEGYSSAAVHADGSISYFGAPFYHGMENLTFDKPIASLEGNEDHMLFLMEDGSLETFQNYYRAPDTPEDLPPLISVKAGRGLHNVTFGSVDFWCLGLTGEGNVVAWGENRFGQSDVPDGLDNVVAIAAGDCGGYYGGGHSLALRKDGTVVAWGFNQSGQASVPSGLNDAVAIAAGSLHSVALKADGTVAVWGCNNHPGSPLKQIPPGLDNVVAITSGPHSILALKSDGTVIQWGEGITSGQVNPPDGRHDFVAVKAGLDRSFAIRADGSIHAWGGGAGAIEYANSMSGVVDVLPFDGWRDCFLLNNSTPFDPEFASINYAIRERPTPAVTDNFQRLYAHMRSYLNDPLNDDVTVAVRRLNGSLELLKAVTSLALPQSIEQDDALRGFLFGSEAIPDQIIATEVYETELNRLALSMWERPNRIHPIPRARFDAFETRLNSHLDEIAATGKPELPRLISHTLSMLEILKSANLGGETPSPVFDLVGGTLQTDKVEIPLYGEPFIHYALETSSDMDTWSFPKQIIHSGQTAISELSSPDTATFMRASLDPEGL
jgi:alpha-tubulin suppressor-like RCC1 family protein